MFVWLIFFGLWYFTGSFLAAIGIVIAFSIVANVIAIPFRILAFARDVGASAQVKQIATRDSTKVS